MSKNGFGDSEESSINAFEVGGGGGVLKALLSADGRRLAIEQTVDPER